MSLFNCVASALSFQGILSPLILAGVYVLCSFPILKWDKVCRRGLQDHSIVIKGCKGPGDSLYLLYLLQEA